MARPGPDSGCPPCRNRRRPASMMDVVTALLVEPDRGADRKPGPAPEPAPPPSLPQKVFALDRPDYRTAAAAERARKLNLLDRVKPRRQGRRRYAPW